MDGKRLVAMAVTAALGAATALGAAACGEDRGELEIEGGTTGTGTVGTGTAGTIPGAPATTPTVEEAPPETTTSP